MREKKNNNGRNVSERMGPLRTSPGKPSTNKWWSKQGEMTPNSNGQAERSHQVLNSGQPLKESEGGPKPIDTRRLVIHQASYVLSETLFQLAQEASVTRARIEEAVKDWARRICISMPPSKFAASTLVELLEADLMAMVKPPIWPAVKKIYLHDWRYGRDEITEEDIRRIETVNELRKYDIFFNAIELRAWVNREWRKLGNQGAQLCEFVLRRVGRTYTRHDVETALWPEEWPVSKTTYSRPKTSEFFKASM
jgi:hypothetical protein